MRKTRRNLFSPEKPLPAPRIICSDPDDPPGQRQLHAIEGPDVVGPAVAQDVMNAPALDDPGTADFHARDVGVADTLANAVFGCP